MMVVQAGKVEQRHSIHTDTFQLLPSLSEFRATQSLTALCCVAPVHKHTNTNTHTHTHMRAFAQEECCLKSSHQIGMTQDQPGFYTRLLGKMLEVLTPSKARHQKSELQAHAAL